MVLDIEVLFVRFLFCKTACQRDGMSFSADRLADFERNNLEFVYHCRYAFSDRPALWTPAQDSRRISSFATGG
jgi:hypothetical protein